MSTKIYVGNLPYSVTDSSLKAIFLNSEALPLPKS
jgi:RNA recognition motif-containing protein